MKTNNLIDVLVIGGGPAGSTAASFAAKSKLSVILIEKEIFPRDHVGESLLPASMPILEELGVLEKIESAGFLKKYGATMVWGNNNIPWSWQFSETNTKYTHAYQVTRSIFDGILLNRSKELNVDVREGESAIEINLLEGTRGVTIRKSDGKKYFQPANIIIDASGQSALISRQTNTRKWDTHFQNLAAYAYFKNGDKLAKPNENNIFIESFENGWIWSIPLKDNFTSVGVVTDAEISKNYLMSANSRDFLFHNIAKAPLTSQMLKSAELVSTTKILKDWSYKTEHMAGNGWVLAGDSACFIDPLFSSGVHLAMMSGVLSSAYAVTYNKNKSFAKHCESIYEEIFDEEYSHFRDLALLFYSSNRSVDSYFWEARRLLEDESYYSSRSSFIRAISGQSTRGYERVALEHGELPPEFIRAVEKHSSESQTRTHILKSFSSEIKYKIPTLSPDAKVTRTPVLANGEFEWGIVLTYGNNKKGIPCSNLVASILNLVDANKNIEHIARDIALKSTESPENIISYVIQTLKILFVEGVVQELK
jgi:flavin-dependent dehydrogenase